MGSRPSTADASNVVLVLMMAGLFGLGYFGLLLYLGAPLAYAVVFDGGLITLFFMENVALMNDLESKPDPDEALLRSDRLQRETIKQLSNQRSVLQKQLLDLELSVKRRKEMKGSLSRSCGDLYSGLNSS